MNQKGQQSRTVETEKNNDPISRRGLPWLCWLALPPVVYVLSAGPVTKMVESHPLPSGLRNVYDPLAWVACHCPPLERFLYWYMADVWHCAMVRH